jgi:protein-disulfide isomerase
MRHPVLGAIGFALLSAAVAVHEPVQEYVTGYAIGPADAAVVVTEFSDFGCAYCGVFARTVFPELKREFVDPGHVRWLHVPFVMGSLPNSDVAAHAAACAGDDGRFWAMHHRLFERQREWQNARDPVGVFGGYAREIGLGAPGFHTCMTAEGRADVDRANEMAFVADVQATPTFFINGKRLEGAVPLDRWREILRWELSGK